MSKRKNDELREGAAESKRSTDDAHVAEMFTSTDFTQMVNDSKLCFKGLQKFCQSVKQWTITKPPYDVLKSYITISPDCTEIFKCLEMKEVSPLNVATIFEAFVKILLRTADDLSESFSMVGVTICRRLLQGHLFKLYGALSIKKPPKVIVSALRLLTAMVMQGRTCAADVAMHLDLSGNMFEILSTYEQDEQYIRFSNVRLCYIRFVLSFFMVGDLRTIQQVLDAQGFVDSVFNRLSTDDSASSIHLFLTVLLEKVIKQTYIPKTNKIRLLGRRGVLLSVVNLFKWDGTMDISAQEGSPNSDKTIIHELAYNFLFHACCPFKYGINFFDPEFGTASRSGNFNLLKFLIDLDKMAANNALARTLAVEIFKSCPDLLCSYFPATNISFEPRISEQWFANCRLVQDIYSNQPSLPPALKAATKHRQTTTPGFEPAKLVAMTLPGIIPAVFDRPTLRAMITHQEATVQSEALTFIGPALQKLKTSLEFLNDASNWTYATYPEEVRTVVCKQLQEAVKTHLPNIADIVSVWESTYKHREEEDMEIKLLNVLSLYQQTLSAAFGVSSYDFSHLLAGLMRNVTTESHRKCFLYLINILMPSVSKYKWFKQQGKDKQTPFYQLVQIILDLMNEGKDCVLIDSALNLVLKIANLYSVVADKKYNSEILIWIQHLYLSCKGSHDESGRDFLVKFFEKSIFRIARTPQRYADHLAKLLESSEENLHSESLDRSHVDAKWYKNLPTLIIERSTEDHVLSSDQPSSDDSTQEIDISLLLMSSFEYIAMLQVDNNQKDHVDLIDRYYSNVLTNLLHLQSYGPKFQQFLYVITSLSSEISNLASFPQLNKLRQDVSVWNLSSSSSQSVDIGSVAVSNKSPQKKKHKHTVRKSLDAKCKSLVQSIGNLSSDHDRNSTVCGTCFQSVHVESKIAEMLFLLKAVFDILRSEEDKSDHFFKSCLQLCNIMQRYLSNIERLDPTRLEGEADNSTVEESPMKDDSSEMDSLSESDDSSQDEELMSSTEEKQQSRQFVMRRGDFVELSATVLNAQILKDIFLYSGKELANSTDIVAIPSDLMADLLSSCLSTSTNKLIFNVYKEKLTAAMLDIVLDSRTNHSTALQAIIQNCFNKVHSHLDQDRLLKILNGASLEAITNSSNGFAVSAVNSCLGVLLMQSDFAATSISTTTVKNLFDILVGLKPSGDDFHSLLSLVVKLVRAFPSVSLFAPLVTVTWCLKQCEVERVVDLLKILVTQNFLLQKELIDLCRGGEHDLKEKPAASKRCLLPVISSVLQHPLKSQFPSLTDDFVAKVKSAFTKLLLCDLLEDSDNFASGTVDVIQWLLSNNMLLKKQFKQLRNALPNLLEDVTMFSIRWKVSTTCLEISKRQQTEDKTNQFRLQLTESLLTFSCKLLKRDENSALAIVSEKLITMLDDLRQVSWTFLEANCELNTWSRYVKQALKYHLSSASILNVVITIVQLMYRADDIPGELIKASQLRKMITSHSGFIDGWMNDKEEAQTSKAALAKLLYELTCRCSKEDLHSADYLFLLGAYGGTLSICDQYIFQTMLVYESMDISPEEYKPFLWGSVAVNAYPSYKEQAETLYHKPPPNRVLKDDPKNFTPFSDQVSSADAGRACYDPAFILGVISHLLAPENLIDCRRFLDQNVLSFLFMCLSSHCVYVRHMAADCLTSFYEQAQPLKFAEKDLILYLLRLVRNAVKLGPDGSLRKQTSIISVFLSQAVQYMMRPSEHIFVVIQRFLLVKPELDMKDIPEFYHTFFSSAMDYKLERSWILDLICLGMQDTNDFHVAERRQLYRILMCFYESPLSDNSSRRKVLEIIGKTCAIRGAAFTLINNQALLPWLLNITMLQRDKSLSHDSGLDVLKRQDSTLQICKIIKRLWMSLAPPTSEPTNRKSIDLKSDQSKVIPLKEDVNESGNSAETVAKVDLEMPALKRDRVELSVKNYPQLISICFDLLTNLLKICGADKVDQLQDLSPDDDTLTAFADILKTLNEIFKHANRNTAVESDGENNEENRMSLLSSLPTHQTHLLRKASTVVAAGNTAALSHALEIMTNWVPKINEIPDFSLTIDNLEWGLDAANKMKGQSSFNDVQMTDIVKWLQSWLETLPKPCAGTNRLKRGLVRCNEVVCQIEESHCPGTLPVVHKLMSLVLNQVETSKQSPPTDKLEEIHRMRQQLYCAS